MKLISEDKKLINMLVESTTNKSENVEAGGLIYSSDDMPNQLAYIDSGRARIIDTSCTFGKQTVSRIDAPQLFGLSRFLSSSYKEEIRAATECNCTIIDAESLDAEAVIALKDLIAKQPDECEWATIYQVVKQRFQDIVPSLDRYTDFSSHCSIITSPNYLQSLIDELGTNEFPIIFIDESKDGFTYGQVLTNEICNFAFSPEDWPRLLAYTRTQSTNIANISIPGDNTTNINPNPDSKNIKPKNFNSDADLENKNTSQDKQVFDRGQDKDTNGFNFIRASNRRDAFFACLLMLNTYFNLPSRRDALQRSADFLDKRNNTWSSDILLILDKFGLAVREVTSDIKRPLNLPIPSVWIDRKGFCNLIVHRGTRSITILNPIEGKQKLNHSEAFQLLSESPEVVAVDIGLHTPTKRFNILWLIPYIKRYRIQLIEVFAASALTQIFALATPLLFQQIIDRVISKGATDALGPFAILMMVCALLEVTFSSLRTFQFVEISNRIDIGVGSAIISRLMRLNARFFDSRPVGELSSRMGELANIRNFLTGTALTVVLDAIFSLLYFAVMFTYSALLTFIIMGTIIPLMLVTIGITPITQRLIRSRAEAAARTQALLVEILGGIQTVKLQNAEISSRQKWEERHLKTINAGFKAVLANTSSSNAIQLINKVSNIVVIGAGASLVLDGKLSLGQLIAFRIISGYVTQPMMRLASSWKSFQELSLSLERVGDIVNQSLEVQENEDNNVVIPELEGQINLRSVSYEYSSSSPPVLSSLTLDIPAGSFTGFVGQSGCGKSTLLKLIPRLYRPSAGKVLIDNYDISKVDLYSLRSQMGFVPQDCMLFEGTIFSNIAISDINTSSQKVVEMAKLACAHEFIMNLPSGYSTPIGERGAGLSGGQRQRIALARMLLEKPRLVVLDEATSALDVDTEKQVVENLRNYFENTTLLMITHRISTLIEADQIVVMHSGRIDATGTHQTLMAQKGRYYALYRSQFGE